MLQQILQGKLQSPLCKVANKLHLNADQPREQNGTCHRDAMNFLIHYCIQDSDTLQAKKQHESELVLNVPKLTKRNIPPFLNLYSS